MFRCLYSFILNIDSVFLEVTYCFDHLGMSNFNLFFHHHEYEYYEHDNIRLLIQLCGSLA